MALLSPVKVLPLLLALHWALATQDTPPNSSAECQHSVRPRMFIVNIKCNTSTLGEKQKQEVQASTTVMWIPLLYLGAFLVGLPANILALAVLVFHTQKLPSTVLLINLTISDLLLLLVLPFRIIYHFVGNDWFFGEPFCRIVTAIFYGNMYGSILCLMLVSLDRYVALVHPFGAKTLRSHRNSIWMSLAVWVVVLVTMLPLLLSQQSYKLDDPPIITCHDALPAEEQENFLFPYFSTLFGLCFLLPLLVIVFCYSCVMRTLLTSGQRYAHAVRITALVLLVFVACFLPSNSLLLLNYSHSPLVADPQDLYVPYMVTLALSCYGPCIDPFIYYYVSDDFRAKVVRVLCCSGKATIDSFGNRTTASTSSTKSKSTYLSKSIRDTDILNHNPSEMSL